MSIYVFIIILLGLVIYLWFYIYVSSQRNEWLKNCQLIENTESNKLIYLCELHFDKTSFNDLKELVSNAIPTIFDKVDGMYNNN